MAQAALRLNYSLLAGACAASTALAALAADFDARKVYDKLDRDRLYPQASTAETTRIVFTSRVEAVMETTWTAQNVRVWTHSPLERAPSLLSLPATNLARKQAVERAGTNRP